MNGEAMHLSKKDLTATGMVGAALALYLLWAAGARAPGLHSTRSTGAVIVLLGFVASAFAVVPTFLQLLHGNKMYLSLTSLIGGVAFIAGIQVLRASSGIALTVVMAAMVVLWAMATAHHNHLANRPTRPTTDESHARVPQRSQGGSGRP
jgi:hypothetical protein